MLRNLHFWRVWLPPHALAIAGLWWCGSITVWLVALAFYVLISGLGVAVGLHRFFSHKAFETSRFWSQVMLFCGVLAAHGNPLFWVALHRGLHHRYADKERDPHSPLHGVLHAYQGYAFTIDASKVPLRAAADFLRHPEWQWSVKHYHAVLWTAWLVAGLISPVVLTALAMAQVWAIHQEALVNVLGHTRRGAYRNHDTDDMSVNRPLLGLFTWGQALHNNHHADPSRYNFGERWFEFDPCRLWVAVIRR